MSSLQIVRKLRLAIAFVFCTGAIFIYCIDAFSQTQIVQLPTTGTFSIQTSVSVPDSGSAFLGGNRSSRMGSQLRGPLGAHSSQSTGNAAGASVHATIIDLNELDLMIRSQAGSKPTVPDLTSHPSKPSKYATGQRGTRVQNAEYEYLAALTHTTKAGPDKISSDTNYYLALASNAKQQRHWSAVELYYKLAWESLPQSRRDGVLKSLELARSTSAAEQIKK